jgi:predicted AlkP superfamily phosphohydrolase/phosphomutase
MAVVLIGLDSVDLDYCEGRLDRMPRLRDFLAGATVRRLDSPADVMSATVWPTFYTGTPPGEHGQYFPMQWDPERMRLRHVGPDWIDCEPWWRPLARGGVAVTTLDVQCVFPSRTCDGVEIVNWGVDAFGGYHCNQPELARDVVRRFGSNPMGFDAPVDKSRTRLGEMRRALFQSLATRGALARWLMTQTRWELFVVAFPECHRAGHYFWPNGDDDGAAATLLEAHEALDAELGLLLDAIDLRTTTVVVFSLLGMARNRSQMHFMPALMDRVNAAFRADAGLGARPQRSLMRRLRTTVPPALQERVALAVPERLRDWVIGHAYAGGLDWSATPAFALPTGGEGYVRLNVAGRERTGCLPGGGELYERYRSFLRESFASLRVADTGEPLVGDVHFPTDHFAGVRARNLPDVAIAWAAGAPATAVRSDRLGTLTGRLATGRPGNHRAHAFAAVAGPARTAPPVAGMRTILDLSRVARDLVEAR